MTTTSRFAQHSSCKLLLLARGFLISLLLCGCVSTSWTTQAESSGIQQMPQVIVKFKDPAVNPAKHGYLQELSREIGATLVYVRPMSGRAHVLRIESSGNAESLHRVVEGLSKRSDVEYAEPDRLLHPMQR